MLLDYVFLWLSVGIDVGYAGYVGVFRCAARRTSRKFSEFDTNSEILIQIVTHLFNRSNQKLPVEFGNDAQ